MQRAVDLSFFNAAEIDSDLLNFTYVKSVSYDKIAGTITVHFSDGGVDSLPSYIPAVPLDVVDASIVGNNLIFTMSDGSTVDAGNVAKKIDIVYPLVQGHGLLTRSGIYKPLEAGAVGLTITESNDALDIDFVSAGNNGPAVTNDTMRIETAAMFQITVASVGTGLQSAGATTAQTWHPRNFNAVKSNLLGVVQSGTQFTLPAGMYCINAHTQAYMTGESALKLINVDSGTDIVSSLPISASRDVAAVDLILNDYFYLAVPTIVELRQWAQLASASGLGRGNYGGNWGNEQIFGKLTFWKIADAQIPVAPSTLVEYSNYAQQWQELYNQRKDIKSDVQYGSNPPVGYVQCSFTLVHDNYTYFLTVTTLVDEIIRYDSITGEAVSIRIPPDVATALYAGDYSYWAPAVLVKGKYYIIPYTGRFIIVFDPVTESFAYSDYGLNLTGGRKWRTAVYVPAVDKIICQPIDAAGFLVLDTSEPVDIFYVTTPDMATGVATGFNIISSGNNTPAYVPQLAFKARLGTVEADSWYSTNDGGPTDANPHWIGIEYPQPIVINAWSMQDSTAIQPKPIRGTIQGSHDGITWDTLDRWTYPAASLVALGVRPTRKFTNTTAYKFYRLTAFEKAGTLNYIAVMRLFLLNTDRSLSYATEPRTFMHTGATEYYLAAPNTFAAVPEGFTVTSSGNYNNNYLPTRLFNPVDATNGQDGWFSQYPAAAPTDAAPHWAQIEYPTAVQIDAYVIQNTSDSEVVKVLKGALLGSNDGTDWTTLDAWEYTAASAVSLGLRPLRKIATPGSYKFYRLAIYKTNEITHNGTFLNYVVISRLHLLSKVNTTQYYPNPRAFISPMATIENFGLSMTATNKYGGLALADNGFLYAIPYNIQGILKIDPKTLTATTIATSFSGTFNWLSAYYSAVQNKIIGIPYQSADFLVLDCNNDTFTRNTFGLTLPGGPTKYLYTFLDSTKNQVVANPLTFHSFLFFDLNTLTAKLVPIPWPWPAATWRPWTGVTANRKAVCIDQSNLTKLYEIDVDTYDFSTRWSSMVNFGSSGSVKWTGACLGSDGKAYAFPGVIDYALAFKSNAFYPLEDNRLAATTEKYTGAVEHNGDVYAIPGTATAMMKIAAPKMLPGASLDSAGIIDSVQYYLITPDMASNEQAGIKVSSSGALVGYEAWKALDREYTSEGESWVSEPRAFSVADPHYWQIEFPGAMELTAVRIRNTYNFSLVTGAVQGSEDGVNWVTLLDIPQESSNQWRAWEWRRVWTLPTPAFYKFYRIAAYTSGHGSYFGIADIQLLSTRANTAPYFAGTEREEAMRYAGERYYYLTTPLGSNLYNNCLVRASSEFDGRYLAWNAFQRVYSTVTTDAWVSKEGRATTANPQWLQISYPNPVIVDAVVLYEAHNHFPLTGKFQASLDGTTWVDLYSFDVAANTLKAWTLREPWILTHNTAYKHYRLYVTNSSNVDYVGVGELVLLTKAKYDPYNTIGALHALATRELDYSEVIPPMNGYSNAVATITASGEFDPATYPAWKAFQRIYSRVNTDAWLSERRAATPENPYWLKVQFNQPKVIHAYRIWNGDKPHALRGTVEASNDDQNWTVLDTFNLQTVPTSYTWRDLVVLNNTTAYTYYRLTVSQISEWDAVSIGEWVLLDKSSAADKSVIEMNQTLQAPAGTTKWFGGVWDPNTAKMYFTPFTRKDIGVFDPVTKTLTTETYGYVFSATTMCGGIDDSGNLLIVGFGNTDQVMLNTISKTITKINTNERGYPTAAGSFQKGQWAIDDSVLLGATDQDPRVFKIEPKLGFMMPTGTLKSKNAGRQSASRVLSNGLSLFLPYNGTNQQTWAYDTMLGYWETIPGTVDSGGAAYFDAVTFPDGVTVALPHVSAATPMRIVPKVSSPVPLALLMDYRINHT